MKNTLKFTIGLLSSIGLMAFSVESKAADNATVKVEAGPAIPFTKPQETTALSPGAAVTIRPLVGITSWLDIGPSLSLSVMQNSDSGGNPLATFGLGYTVRVKRPHDYTNTGTGLSAIAPWVDADVQAVFVDKTTRPAFSLGVGASLPTNDKRSLWIGPFARLQEVVEPTHSNSGYNKKSVIFGLSVEYGGPNPRSVEADTDHDGLLDSKDCCPTVAGPADNCGCPREPVSTPVVDKVPVVIPVTPSQEVKFELKQRVQFAWNSVDLQEIELAKLKEVAGAIVSNTNYNIVVDGHASSEGQVAYNNKLSQARADSVVNYLVGHGVSKDRVKAVGFGSSVPVADNATKEGREANRRVDFVIDISVNK